MSMQQNLKRREIKHPGSIPRQALEVIADILLAVADRDEEYPAYSEVQLKRKCRNGSRAELHSGLRPPIWADVLLAEEVTDLVQAAELSHDQRVAWEMHLAGYSPAEIARMLDVARPTAVKLVTTASRRISNCPARYRGLHAVYLSQIRRRIYRNPKRTGENRPLERLYAECEDVPE